MASKIRTLLHNFWLIIFSLLLQLMSVGFAWNSSAKSNPKLVNQNVQHCTYLRCNLIVILIVWADLAVFNVLKFSTTLLKYPSFEGLFHVFMDKTSTKLLHIEVCTIKVDYLKSEKKIIFALIFTFCGQSTINCKWEKKTSTFTAKPSGKLRQ